MNFLASFAIHPRCFYTAPDLSFQYGPLLAFAKNLTVLQSISDHIFVQNVFCWAYYCVCVRLCECLVGEGGWGAGRAGKPGGDGSKEGYQGVTLQNVWICCECRNTSYFTQKVSFTHRLTFRHNLNKFQTKNSDTFTIPRLVNLCPQKTN